MCYINWLLQGGKVKENHNKSSTTFIAHRRGRKTLRAENAFRTYNDLKLIRPCKNANLGMGDHSYL